MALLGQIDFNEVHTNDELLPAGEYQAIIVASGAKPEDPQTAEGYVISKSGKGAFLPMTFEICEGEYKGRQIRKNFNLKNLEEFANFQFDYFDEFSSKRILDYVLDENE